MSLGPLLFGAALGQLLAITASRRFPRLWLLATVGSAVAALFAAGAVLFCGQTWDWEGGLSLAGNRLHLHVDPLSAFFVTLLAVVEASAAVYAREYWTDRAHPRSAPAGR